MTWHLPEPYMKSSCMGIFHLGSLNLKGVSQLPHFPWNQPRTGQYDRKLPFLQQVGKFPLISTFFSHSNMLFSSIFSIFHSSLEGLILQRTRSFNYCQNNTCNKSPPTQRHKWYACMTLSLWSFNSSRLGSVGLDSSCELDLGLFHIEPVATQGIVSVKKQMQKTEKQIW